jgi:predicted DNA-binding transcriptional regulator AlpA
MLATIQETADRLRVHKSTVWRLVRDDKTFPEVLYIRRRCPRLRVSDVDRWSQLQGDAKDLTYIAPDLLTGTPRGARPRKKAAA